MMVKMVWPKSVTMVAKMVPKRRVMRGAAVLALVLSSGIISGGQAMAAKDAPAVTRVTVGSYSVYYNKNWSSPAYGIARCITINANGNINYTLSYVTIKGITTYSWTNQTLSYPQLKITVVAMGLRSSCGSSAKLTQ